MRVLTVEITVEKTEIVAEYFRSRYNKIDEMTVSLPNKIISIGQKNNQYRSYDRYE